MHTPEEQNLLNKLADGSLDGMVGDEREYREYHSIYCGKTIRNGTPIIYRQSQPTQTADTSGNKNGISQRSEKVYATDEQKRLFLQRYGWLMEDEQVRAYSALYKPEHGRR